MRTETGVVVDKISFQKLLNSVLFGSGCRPSWSCCHCSVQWRRTVTVFQHAL